MQPTFVDHLLTRIASLGVREVCVAAGARNINLIRGLTASRNLRLWRFFEERSMAFFALGRMLATRRPVAVVTTSGTAAVETMPAVVEAHHQGLPLVVITADRPRSYRGSGAPQTIDQTHLFGAHADFIDYAEDQEGHDAGWPVALHFQPLHINVSLEEGLTTIHGIDFHEHPPPFTDTPPVALTLHRIDLVLAAGMSPEDALRHEHALLTLGAPIVAEATANLPATLSHLVTRGGESALAAANPSRVLRLGSVPSWRWWRDLESKPQIEVIHLSQAPYPGLARDCGKKVWPQSTAWAAHPGKCLPLPALDLPLDTAVATHPLSEPAWMRHLSLVVSPGAAVFLGNSLPIREWNLAAATRHDVAFYANRGTNGIDGLISTFLGLGADERESWIILGDLSALYDLSAPWVLEQLPAANRRIVVINNGGGQIFGRVKSLQALDEQTRPWIINPHQHRFASWAAMWGCRYRAVTSPEDLHELPDGPLVLEVLPDAAQSTAFWRDWATTSH